MTKDNLLFAVFGILVGFIAGYLLHEVMAMRQPQRQLAAAGAPMAQPQDGAMPQDPQDAGTAPGGAGAAPAMQQVEALRQRLQANPQDADAMLGLAGLYLQINEWDPARQYLEQYLKIRPANPNVLSDLALTYRGLGRYDEALQLLHQAEGLDPNHWQSLYNEVLILAFDQGKLEDAQRVVQRLQQVQPGNPNVQKLAAELERSRNTPS